MIKLLDECDHDRSDKTFSLVFVDCNRAKQTGGRLMVIEVGKKCGLPYHCADYEMRGIKNMESGKISAFHLRLTLQINGLNVYW